MKQLIRNILKEEKESFYKKVADILEPPYFENLEKMAITEKDEIKKILEHKFDHPIRCYHQPPTMSGGEIIDDAVGWVEYGGKNPNLYQDTTIGAIGSVGKVLYSEEGDYWGVKEYNEGGEVTNEWDVGGW
ncbi:MAG: hypothetical protein ACW980_23955 [Promethearchaeota archaeon]|jgi:hypothetical protein